MTEEFNTPQPGALLEVPEGWDVLYAAEGNRPALTDEKIMEIAARHRNHVLTAQSGAKFDVIEHDALVAFARDIERAVVRQQVMGLVETVARLKRERDVAEERYEAIRARGVE